MILACNKYVLRKQVDHHSPAEWTANNDSIALATKQVISSSHNLRTQSHYQRNESKNRILWKNQETNLALSERVLDIKLWHKTLEETLKTIEEEISALLETKTALESALMNKVPLLEATKMCLMLKDRRTNVDVVEDDQYHQMKKEIKLLENISQKLQQKSKSVWEHLCRLKHTRDHLKADIVDKLSAHNIETYQLDLHTKSAGITLKPFPVEVPVSTVTPEQWHGFSQSNKTSAENEMESARYLCLDALALIRDTENQTSSQREATAFAIRKRIHELKQTRDMLVVQQENLEREIARGRNEVQELEKSLQDTAGPMKVVQTRLENRKWRPQMELCGDTPQTSLHQEFMHLRDVQSALQQKLQEASLLNMARMTLSSTTRNEPKATEPRWYRTKL
ncbi:tektin-B1-like [Tachypleus tridentatus]|uniref:tektin-B1-like n=1 Tax=Tachypleus tridentatus TaxID=6853 RepID=UPI003FD1FF51